MNLATPRFSDSHSTPPLLTGFAAQAAMGNYYYVSRNEAHSLPASPVLQQLAGESMGTYWSVKYVRNAALRADHTQVNAAIETALNQVVVEMSTWAADSALSCYNQCTQSRWITVPKALFEVLSCALRIAEKSGGAYDPSIGPLVNLWGFGPRDRQQHHYCIPDAIELAATRQRCGWQQIQLKPDTLEVWQPGNTYLDLSAIAKGYAVDAAVQALQGLGVVNLLVEIGGELRACGQRPDGHPWQVAIETLTDSTANKPSTIRLQQQAIATSGVGYQQFTVQGRNYSHTLDPRNGEPIAHALRSVSVIHSSCMLADAWATALLVLGPNDGLALAQRERLAALFTTVEDDGSVHCTMTSAWLLHRVPLAR